MGTSTAFVNGPIMQIGCVVEDLAAAERTYAESFGVRHWTRFTGIGFTPDRATYRGRPADCVIDISLGYSGAQQIELIQPISGVNIYTEYLDRSGPGVHHLAWAVDDLDAAVAEARSRGLEVVQQGAMDGMSFAYLETPGLGMHFVELMQLSPAMRSSFAAMQAAAVEQ